MGLRDETLAQTNRRYAQNRLRKNAAGLRDLADQFERVADDLNHVPSPGRPNATQVVSAVLHDHATWLANAHLEQAVQYAAEADVCAAEDVRAAANFQRGFVEGEAVNDAHRDLALGYELRPEQAAALKRNGHD